MSALIFVFLGLISGYFLCRTISEGERKNIFYIFLTAFALRIAVALVLYIIAVNKGKMGFFLGLDDWYSGNTSLEIVQAWREGSLFYSSWGVRLPGAYELFVGALMLLFGDNTFLPIILNCAWGALSVIMIYKLSRFFFNEKVSMISSLLLTFWPSLVFWSALNLREAPVTFAILVIMFLIVRIACKGVIYKNAFPQYFILFIFMFLLYLLRKEMLYLIGAAVFIVIIVGVVKNLVISPRLFTKILAIILLLFLATSPLLIMKSGVAPRLVEFLQGEVGIIGTVFLDPVSAINEFRLKRARGESPILPDLHIGSYGDLIWFLPSGLIIAFVYPLPWQATSLMSLAAIPEMLLWYVLLLFFIRGIFVSFKALKERRKELSFLFLFIFLFFMFLFLYEGNAGALFRHRGMILPFVFMFVAAGIPYKVPPTPISSKN